ncbi:uncharacterized protein L969DRAFT_59737 [Mixia osmundae IAM 14324]|uniref:Photolyase/cryptochrome alpha/beta domain-containing protein n=1 Tax=Mixia osmundae (strain CBS 9802 / IAM 14324 / JCM 22182 / KY 12970) TaxID=764103 RepID=G7E5F6_MIXOS|nr:uncharacterized protein L969DRAFT_59737 [Mixia osmundae IAM 14324]KEI40783.1 hypothetical protein L969DRAFT_59737 [Mixia osmundae IAM 14324]GAA98066.1 hypothetical protein E5Q_04748 [Mixia osmundae IAM 14324]
MARVIYWFRTDLRLHDSPALQAALDLKPDVLFPTWCFDPRYVYEQRVGPNRWKFLLESMSDTSAAITKVNPKSQLFVLRGHPTTILPALLRKWKISDIVWEKDDDPYTMERDKAVEKLAKDAGVKVHVVHGHTLYDAEAIEAKTKGKPYVSYGPFVKILEGLPQPPRPIDAPSSLPNPGPTDLADLKRSEHSVDTWKKNDNNAENRDGEDKIYASFTGPDGKFSVPTMEELGMAKATGIHPGGETEALKRLEAYMKDKEAIINFEKPKTNPGAFDPAATTVLSPYLKFGALSVRTFYWRLQDVVKGTKHTQPPVSLIGQCLWREFFHYNMRVTPNWHEIRGNPICKYIDWRLDDRYDDKGEPIPRSEWKLSDEEKEAEKVLEAWTHGQTGFPWIDAIMRQLKMHGWIHHLARHSVACFLTRGHAYISWVRGKEVFERWLIDHDPAMNTGNWMWLSASAFYSQWFRVYGMAYGSNWDKSGALIREFCPELNKLPDKYIYEPWKAPVSVLKEAGVTLGQTYPRPIFDDKAAKAETQAKMKNAYHVNIHGDHEAVLNGTAAKMLKEGAAAAGDGEESESKSPSKKRKPDSKGKDGLKQPKLKMK